MIKIAVVIETRDRRLNGQTVNYMGKTLENFNRAGGFQAPELAGFGICVGGSSEEFEKEELQIQCVPAVLCGKPVLIESAPATRQQNAQRAISLGTIFNADYVLKLEDDLDFCADFVSGAARWLERRTGSAPMYSLAASFEKVSESRFENFEDRTIFDPGDSFPRVRAAIAQGLDELAHPALGYWGAQAVAFPMKCAVNLAEYLGPDPFFFDGKEHHRNRGHDLKLQQWLYSLGARSVPCAVPAMVQHVGQRSNLDQPSIGHVQPFFQFPFAGREWSYA